MSEREPSPAASEKARELVYTPLVERLELVRRVALALDDFAAQRERAGLEKAASSVEGAPKGCIDFYATFVTRKEAASAIRALMVEPSEKETGR